jgi:ABC-type nitrate/sulfonate/bicarbonate transport system permease component
MLGLVDSFLLPSPVQVLKAFVEEFSALMQHSAVTLSEAFIGLVLGILFGFVMAVIMDQVDALYKAFYPLIVLTQTVPTVAIAPLLVLWFGYEMAPKIILIVITTFFPITVGLLNGFRSADQDSINLLRAMGQADGRSLESSSCREHYHSFLQDFAFPHPMRWLVQSFQNGWVALAVSVFI